LGHAGFGKPGEERVPSRAEITDAAMGERAECVMLNKGPYILEAVHVLDDILRRMEKHQKKKRSMLRHLRLADNFAVLKKKSCELKIIDEQLRQPQRAFGKCLTKDRRIGSRFHRRPLTMTRKVFSLLNSFNPTSAYPEFPNDSGKSTKEEKQTQGREKDRQREDDVPRDLYVLIADHAEAPNKATPYRYLYHPHCFVRPFTKVIGAVEHPPWSHAQRHRDVPGANRR
jgi:pyruvate kinase